MNITGKQKADDGLPRLGPRKGDSGEEWGWPVGFGSA